MAFGFKHGSKRLLKFIAKPTVTGSYTFDNAAKSAVISGYDADAMTISGTRSATSAGTYTVKFTLKRGYMWSDRTQDVVSRTWSIAKRSIAIPTMTNKSFTYAVNSTFAPTISGVNSYITQTGTASATKAGSYSVAWALKYPNDTLWSDGTTTNKSSSWTVAKRSITIPTLNGTSYTWDINKTFSTTVVSFDSTYATQSGVTSSTNAGSWTITWKLKDTVNTQWAGGTITDKTASWTVAKKSITVPTLTNGSQTWTINTTHKPTITGVDTNYITQSGVVSSTSAGSWTVTWALKSTAKTQWADKTIANKTATWSVAKRSIAIPTMKNTSYTWDVNKTFAPTISGVTANYVTQSGTVSSTNAGSWTVTWKLVDSTNSYWSDKTTANKTATWSVSKKTIAVPTMTNTSYTWEVNKTYKPTISGVDTNYITQSGTASSSNAGSWTITWKLKSTANTQWTGGTTADKTATWSVAKRTLTVPSISGTKSFAFIEGTSRSVTVANFNSTYETQSGKTSESAMGTYTLTWALRYPDNTQWSGGTTTNKTASWDIKWVNGTSYYKNDLYNRGKIIPSRLEGIGRTSVNDYDITTTDTISSGGSTYYQFMVGFGASSFSGKTKLIIEGENFSSYNSSSTSQYLRYASAWVDESMGGTRGASAASITSTKITYTLYSAAAGAGAVYWRFRVYGSSGSSKITRIYLE